MVDSDKIPMSKKKLKVISIAQKGKHWNFAMLDEVYPTCVLEV